ncbi:MAG: ABC transporter ATP-binding protein [Betaproteobacteria bacterium]
MIRLENLSKHYERDGRQVAAVNGINLEVGRGEICVLLGPSGCGKTTTLKIINRLVVPTGGRVLVDGQDTSEFDAITLRRKIGYVIQQVGLFPHMTVEENIGIVPRLLGWPKERRQKRALELLDMIGLEARQYVGRYPRELSGGQAQRIGVARALAADPPILLMDEPFGALDPVSREALQDEFLAMQARLQKTIIFVSHEIDEAVKMADRIAIFRNGLIVRQGTPDDVLADNDDPFVASFVGRDRALKRLRRHRCKEILEPCTRTFAPGAPHVVPEDDLRTALSLLVEADLDALPCFQPDGNLVGMVRLERIRGLLENGVAREAVA